MTINSRTVLGDDYSTITWHEDDKIYLFGEGAYATMRLIKGAGTEIGMFTGLVNGISSRLDKALYPVPTINGNEYSFDLPASRSYNENSGAPLWGNYQDGNITFANLVSMMRIPLSASATDRVLVLEMEGISGKLVVDVENGTAEMESGATHQVTVNVPAGEACFIDIPVPAKTYPSGYKVSVDGNVIAETAESVELDVNAVKVILNAPVVDESKDELQIATTADLLWVAKQVNTGADDFKGKTLVVIADIDMKGISWTPIGNGGQGAVSFRGEFNGNNHSISNVAINCDSNLDGFFGAVWGATIKDLTLVNVSGVERGLLVAKVNGTESDNQTTTIENVTVNGSSNFKLVGEVSNDALVRIDGAYYVDDNESLEEVLTVSDVNEWNVLLGSGEYTLPYAKYNTINLEGENKGVIMNLPATSHENDYYVGTSLSFKNVTLRGGGYTTTNYDGYVQSSLEVYEDCKFEGYYMFAADEVTVTGCEFVGEDGEYIWTGSASEITFEGCKFSKKNRAVKVLTVGNQQDEPRIVKFNSCKFSADENDKAVLEGESKTGYNYVIYLNDCEMTGAFTKWFNDKTANGGNYTLYFNDKKGTYVTSAAEFKSAMADADDGEAILLENGTYSGLFEFNANKHVTIQALNEKKAVINGRFGVAGSGTVDFEGLTFECKDFTKDFNHQYLKRAGKYIICIYVGNVNVENCEFNTTVEGTGAIHQYAANNTLLVVKNSLFNSNGNYTLRTRGNVTVEDCTFDGMVRQCLQVMSNSDFDQNTTFVGNRITNAGDGVMGVSIGDGYAFNQGMTFEVSNNDASINNISYDPEKSSNILPSLDKHTFTGEVTTIVPETEL